MVDGRRRPGDKDDVVVFDFLHLRDRVGEKSANRLKWTPRIR